MPSISSLRLNRSLYLECTGETVMSCGQFFYLSFEITWSVTRSGGRCFLLEAHDGVAVDVVHGLSSRRSRGLGEFAVLQYVEELEGKRPEFSDCVAIDFSSGVVAARGLVLWEANDSYGGKKRRSSVLSSPPATPDLRSAMANGSTASRHGMFSLPAGSPIGASWVKEKVPPSRSRFSPDAARAHDSFTFLPPASDPPDSAKPLDVRSEKPLFSDDSASTNLRRCRNETTSEKASSSPPPVPPPFPSSTARKPSFPSKLQDPCSCSGSFISDLVLDKWDQVFLEGANVDITVCTAGGGRIYVHSALLMASSPVLKFSLQKELRKSRQPVLRILGVPFHAVRCFLRYLYSSRCERSDMDECALHLLVLAHTYMVPALKRLCTSHFEQGLLNIDTVVDILQIARLCDAPRLYLLCLRRIIKDFKVVVRSDGWRVMKHSDPALEQEVIEAVIRASMRKQDKLTKLEDDQVYAQLYDAMEALAHLCRDGCRSMGSPDKTLTKRATVCSYPACKRLEYLVRHFADCKLKVAGGCVHCKRMWQLLELHSRTCSTGDSCKVPLCQHFKDNVGQQSSQKVELRWKMLVQRVKLAKRAVDALR